MIDRTKLSIGDWVLYTDPITKEEYPLNVGVSDLKDMAENDFWYRPMPVTKKFCEMNGIEVEQDSTTRFCGVTLNWIDDALFWTDLWDKIVQVVSVSQLQHIVAVAGDVKILILNVE